MMAGCSPLIAAFRFCTAAASPSLALTVISYSSGSFTELNSVMTMSPFTCVAPHAV